MLECSVFEKPCFLVHASSCCRQHCGRRKRIFLSPSFTDQFRLPHLSYSGECSELRHLLHQISPSPPKKSRNATRQGSSAGSANLPHPDTFLHLLLENMMLLCLSDSQILSQDKEFIQKWILEMSGVPPDRQVKVTWRNSQQLPGCKGWTAPIGRRSDVSPGRPSCSDDKEIRVLGRLLWKKIPSY